MSNNSEQGTTERKAIGKRVRFEVFKRDGFKCQYCGAQAPEAVLEADHINPVSKGGGNDIMNLVTACRSCNAGKSNISLSDDAAIQKQRAMLDELTERREQLEMMLAWREGLKQLDNQTVMKVANAWSEQAQGWSLNDSGLKELKVLLEKVPVLQVLDAIEIAGKYLEKDKDGALTPESVNIAWSKVKGIAKTLCKPETERKLLYIRGICRNRFSYCNEERCLRLLKQAHKAGIDMDGLAETAKNACNWSRWESEMLNLVHQAEK